MNDIKLKQPEHFHSHWLTLRTTWWWLKSWVWFTRPRFLSGTNSVRRARIYVSICLQTRQSYFVFSVQILQFSGNTKSDGVKVRRFAIYKMYMPMMVGWGQGGSHADQFPSRRRVIVPSIGPRWLSARSRHSYCCTSSQRLRARLLLLSPL